MCNIVVTEPGMHTIRTALGSFFYIAMANKPPRSIAEQIDLLKSRGMQFKDDTLASHFLQNISYYRLKDYWWDIQTDIYKQIGSL